MIERMARILVFQHGAASTRGGVRFRTASQQIPTPLRAHNSKARRGFTLMLALVCLLVVAIIGAATVQALLREHKQLQQQQLRDQTFWVAESAIGRAVARLGADAEYTGETWQIAAEEVDGEWPAEAVIRVERVETDQSTRRIFITAHYPKRPLYGIIQQREITIKLPTSGESS
jgi:type II secretory pathway pseudopilin PulG